MDTRHHEEIDACHADHAWSCPSPECGEAACGRGHDHRLAREVRGAWDRSQLTVDERISLTTVLATAARRLIDARYLAGEGEPERATTMLALAQGHLTTVTDALSEAAVAQ